MKLKMLLPVAAGILVGAVLLFLPSEPFRPFHTLKIALLTACGVDWIIRALFRMRREAAKKTLVGLTVAAGLLLSSSAPLPAQTLTPEQILQYLAQHRRDVALASYTVAADGTPDPTDPVLFHNADQPMPLASTIKIVLLAAYAREVTAGRLDPALPVSLADWERYYLPGTDGTAHPRALSDLGIPADEYGFALDPARTVSADALVGAMITFSDNAAADWLYHRLGPDVLRATIQAAGLKGQQMPMSILGVFLSWENHEKGPLTPARLRRLLRLRPRAYAAEVEHWDAAYQDPAWRQAQLQWLLDGSGGSLRLQARAGEGLFPRGTARDYARILARVVTGTFLSPEISALMRRHLEWPLEFPAIRDAFDAFGNKGGSLASVLTDATFLVSKSGDFAGRPRVVALFLKGVSERSYEDLVSSLILYEVALGTDREMAERTARALVRPRR